MNWEGMAAKFAATTEGQLWNRLGGKLPVGKQALGALARTAGRGAARTGSRMGQLALGAWHGSTRAEALGAIGHGVQRLAPTLARGAAWNAGTHLAYNVSNARERRKGVGSLLRHAAIDAVAGAGMSAFAPTALALGARRVGGRTGQTLNSMAMTLHHSGGRVADLMHAAHLFQPNW